MQKLKNKKFTILTYLFFIFWGVYFLIFWSRALFYDPAGNLVAGHVNIWGDWAAHFTMGSAMENRGFILQTSPFLLGAKFSYPFVSNMISAVMLSITGDFIYSFVIPSFFLSIFLVWSVYYFFFTLWKSEKKAILSSLVFMLNGGLGFYFYIRELIAADKPIFKYLLHPLHEVTRYDVQSIKWINVIDSMIIPQRAFLLGFPLTVLTLTIIYKNYFENKKVNLKLNIIAGIILGLMPIIHTHSFLAAFIILAFWSVEHILNHTKINIKKKTIEKWPSEQIRNWSNLAIITAIISLPLIDKYFMGNVDQGFSKFFPGWLARSYQMNWFEFWWRNWFLVPWLSFAGFLMIAKRNIKKLFIFSPFIFIFIIANLYLFQPFAWDNTKMFVWSSLGFSYLTVYVLDSVLNKKKQENKFCLPKRVKFPILSIVFFLIILSGLMDAYYIVRHDLHSHVMYTKEELELTNWVRHQTAKDSIWLTGEQHNHFVFNLTGRQTLMTYRGWLWTHGYDYLQTQNDLTRMYQHPRENRSIFDQYGIDYIIIGNNERRVWNANESEFQEIFPLIKQTNNYKIFRNK